MNDKQHREFAQIKATEWWSLFMSNLNREAEQAAKTALSATDMVNVYRAQGTHRALASMIRVLEDPYFTDSGLLTYGTPDTD